MNTFNAQILTPEGSLFDGEVTGVQVPGEMGSFEVKALHANIISTLEVGEILVRNAGGDETLFAVTGGFVEVVDNKLTLLAEAAEQVENIDVERAKEARDRAQNRLDTENEHEDIDKQRAEAALARAKTRLRIANKASVATQ